MTPERYRRITDVFLHASHQTRNTRAAFLEDTCGADSDLRREVEALLAADEHAAEFLEESADDIAVDLLNTSDDSLVGQQLGEYKVIEFLGAGGMGEVFLARDTRLGRRAALKILPEKYTADPLRCSRLEEEARAIAALNHPNIREKREGRDDSSSKERCDHGYAPGVDDRRASTGTEGQSVGNGKPYSNHESFWPEYAGRSGTRETVG